MTKEKIDIYLFRIKLTKIINLTAEIVTTLRKTKFEAPYISFELQCTKLRKALAKFHFYGPLAEKEKNEIYELIEIYMGEIESAYIKLHSPPMDELDPFLIKQAMLNNRTKERILREITDLDNLYVEMYKFFEDHKTGNVTPARRLVRSIARMFE